MAFNYPINLSAAGGVGQLLIKTGVNVGALANVAVAGVTGGILSLSCALAADATITLPNTTSTLAALGVVQTWTAKQTFAAVDCTSLAASGAVSSTTVFKTMISSYGTTASPVETPIALGKFGPGDSDPAGMYSLNGFTSGDYNWLSFKVTNTGVTSTALTLNRDLSATFASSVSCTTCDAIKALSDTAAVGPNFNLHDATSTRYSLVQQGTNQMQFWVYENGGQTFRKALALENTTGAATFLSSVSCTTLTATSPAGVGFVVADGVVGAASGAYVVVKNGGVGMVGIGNYSSLIGGAYDATATVWSANGLKVMTDGGATTALSIATTTGKATFKAATTAAASITLPHGTAPSSPVNGDMWTTSADLFVRLSGVTTSFLQVKPVSGMPTVRVDGTATLASSSVEATNVTMTCVTSSGTASFTGDVTSLNFDGVNGGSTTLYGYRTVVNMTAAASGSTVDTVFGNTVNLDLRNNNGTSTTATTSVKGLSVEYWVRNLSAGGTWNVTSVYGLYVASSFNNTGTLNITNAYGLYLEDGGSGATFTNRYGIYQVGPSRNYFEGVVGIATLPSATTNLNLLASTTSISSLRIPHGAAPTSPVNGDMWTTTAGLYIRINGVTVGPLS